MLRLLSYFKNKIEIFGFSAANAFHFSANSLIFPKKNFLRKRAWQTCWHHLAEASPCKPQTRFLEKKLNPDTTTARGSRSMNIILPAKLRGKWLGREWARGKVSRFDLAARRFSKISNDSIDGWYSKVMPVTAFSPGCTISSIPSLKRLILWG